MTNQEAAEIVKSAFQAWESEYRCTGEDWSEEHEACEMALKALTEKSIPVDWIEAEIKKLRDMDNGFASLSAGQIGAMLKKWREEQNDKRESDHTC